MIKSQLKRSLAALAFTALISFGCAPKLVDPFSLPVSEADKLQAPFPPLAEELSQEPMSLLHLVTYKDPTVTEARLADVMAFVKEGFATQGNFANLSNETAEKILAMDENRGMNPDNVTDALSLGKSSNALFVSQVRVTILESAIVKGLDQFKANVNLTVFKTDTGQNLVKADLVYDSRKQADSKQKLKEMVQQSFPLRAFILETRGDHWVAKVSIGRRQGIKIGREFAVYDRQVKTDVIGGMSQRTVTVIPQALATAKVIQVDENEAWLEVDKGSRDKVKAGLLVFAQPEKKRLF